MPSDVEFWLGLRGFKRPLSPLEVSAAVTFGVPSPRNLPRVIIVGGRGLRCASPGGPHPHSSGWRERKVLATQNTHQIHAHSRPQSKVGVESGAVAGPPGTQPGEGVLAICWPRGICLRVPRSCDHILHNLSCCRAHPPTYWTPYSVLFSFCLNSPFGGC